MDTIGPYFSTSQTAIKSEKISTHAGVPYTDAQILEKGLSIVRATRDLDYALITWENRPVNEKKLGNLQNPFSFCTASTKDD